MRLQPAKDRLAPCPSRGQATTHNFGTGTRGFAAREDFSVAVCLTPGTELAFSDEMGIPVYGLIRTRTAKLGHKTAIFRQINKNIPNTHRDALELPDGKLLLLTELSEGQSAVVLQLPTQPTSDAEIQEQRRAEYVG